MSTNAREIIDALLQLPSACAGMDSRTLEAEIALIDAVPFTVAEFGALLAEAETARDTVRSALLALRDAAINREHGRP